MSLQSSPHLGSQVGQDGESSSASRDVCYRRVSCSNSQLARDANLSFFQSHQHQAPLDQNHQTSRISNPLAQKEDGYYLQLRKRKCSFISSNQDDRSCVPTVTADFLSGIFEDLAQVHSTQSDTYTDTVPNPLLDSRNSDSHLVHSDSEVSNGPRKRFKGMNRCSKSFAHLPDGRTLDKISQTHATTSMDPSPNTNRAIDPDSITALAHPISADLKAAQIADQVFSDSFCDVHIAFPTLPATVSASSCSSNNLTQTSVQAAQVVETLPKNTGFSENVQGNEQGDTYGWFVEMDEEHVQQRFSAVEAATESCKAIASPPDANLTFRTATIANQVTVELDSEVEWAKAADTVDDVLGELFF